jgi:O-ureido-D-serine cyclo-ligase
VCRALAARGARVDVVDWDDPAVDWSRFDAAIVRATWNYHVDPGAFLAWVDRAAVATRLVNPPDVLRWNIDKRYLADLAGVGLPVIPTTFVASAADARRADLSGDIVVKPTVSAGSNDTARHRGDAAAAGSHVADILASGRGAMVQPYDPDIDEHAETGVVCLGGGVSHAFAKSAMLRNGLGAHNGLFFEEQIAPRDMVDEERALAEAVLEALVDRFGSAPTYARVDMVGGACGRPRIMEVELIEPSLFLHVDDGAADRAAEAFLAVARAK